MKLRANRASWGGSRFLQRVVLPVLLLYLVLPSPSLATQVRSLDLNEMTARADRIFRGRCVNVRVARDPRLGRMVTHVTFVVERSAKGDLRGAVTIRLLDDQQDVAGKRAGIVGMPRFRKGEEVVLFLYPDSRSGLTSPVGFGQGKFDLVKDKQGKLLAVNQFGNKNLHRNLSPPSAGRPRSSPVAAKKAKQPAAGRTEPSSILKPGQPSDRVQHPKGIPPDVLLDLVQRLEK